MTTHEHYTRPDDELDTWLRVLANEQRREIVAHLREESRCSVRDLASHVAASTGPTRVGDPSPPELDRALTELVHIHLPMMDDADLIDWDRDAGCVQAGTVPEQPSWS